MKKNLIIFLVYLSIFSRTTAQTQSNVQTPKGSPVSAWINQESSASTRNYYDNLYQNSGRTYISYFTGEQSSSSRFNCHGYAWNMSEGGPVRWIGYSVTTEEDIYMTDGSYVQVCNEMYPGKVSWGSGDHSAITTATSGRWISKWSLGPLVEHNWNDTPFGTSNLKYYVSTAISGSTAVLCSGTRTFSTRSISGATYSWTTSSSLTITSGAGTNQITVQRNGSANGVGWVQVTISTACSASAATRKTTEFAVGEGTVTNPNYWIFDEWSNMWQLSYSAPAGYTSTYSLVSGSGTLSPHINDCYVTTSTGAVISLISTTSCGSSSPYYFYIPGNGSAISIYPNPVSESLTLEIQSDENVENLPSQILLYPSNSPDQAISIYLDDVLAKKGLIDGNKLEIDVRHLPKGLYFLHIIPKNNKNIQVQKMQIIIE
jgi:hypothetical protein